MTASVRDAASVHPAAIIAGFCLLAVLAIAVLISLPTTSTPAPISLATSQTMPWTSDQQRVAEACGHNATWCARWVITGTSPNLDAGRLRLLDATTDVGPLTCWSAPDKIARGPLHPGDALACGGNSTPPHPGDLMAWSDTATGNIILQAALV